MDTVKWIVIGLVAAVTVAMAVLAVVFAILERRDRDE